MARGALSHERLATAPSSADVVIVGGGPAGSAAAITCATAGLDVVLVHAPRPGDFRGEALHPGVEVVLHRLGVADEVDAAGFLRHSGHWVAWGGPARFEHFGGDASGPWLGYQVPREMFDELLLRRASSMGVTVLQPCLALTVERVAGRVRSVMTARGPVATSIVIDASGRRAWWSRQAGSRALRWSPRLVAAYGHRFGSCPSLDPAPRLRSEPEGWTWIARTAPDVYAWVRVDLNPNPEWGRLPAEVSSLVPDGPTRGADVTWRAFSRAAGPDHILAGDACSVLDPAASDGVLRALLTGIAAGRTARQLLDRRAGQDAAAKYQHWTSMWFKRDVRRLSELYARAWPALLSPQHR